MHQLGSWLNSVSKQINDAVHQGKEDKNQTEDLNTANPADIVLAESDDSKNEIPEVPTPTECPAKQNVDEKSNFKNLLSSIEPKSYAEKILGSVNSLATKIAQANPEDLKHIIDSRLRDLDEENRKFAEEQSKIQTGVKTATGKSAAQPCWKNCAEETIAKKLILSLSLDSRNFLSDPPTQENMDFSFEYAKQVSVAMVMLEEDPNLRKMRFQLVPKVIKEERFWRNYFYRISLIKQSIALRCLNQLEAASTSGVPDTTSPTTSANIENGGLKMVSSLETILTLNDDRESLAMSANSIEFVSDCGAGLLPEAMDGDMMAARQELGILSAESSPRLDRKNLVGPMGMSAKEEWEENDDLLSDLHEYEMVKNQSDENGAKNNANDDWEKELTDLLAKQQKTEEK